MLRKMITAVLIMLCSAGAVFAQLEISGEAKTGLYWEKIESPKKEDTKETVRMHNYDDSGTNEGRFRINMHWKMKDIGMKVRFEKTAWTDELSLRWPFAFAYGDFFDEQLRLVAGKLGESPWSAGGPDIWQELDNQIGIRTEYKPAFVPGLNIGFVLNGYNGSPYYPEKQSLVDIFKETVFGIAYTHEFFHARFSYRLDGEADSWDSAQDGMSLMYRLEERILQKYVEGLQVWLNGYWRGIGLEDEDQDKIDKLFQNWFYAQWAPPQFTAQLRLGYHPSVRVNELHTRLTFMYNIIPNTEPFWLSVGAAFYFQVDTGDTPVKDVPYKMWGIEPQVKLTFASGTYVAFVYYFETMPLSTKTNKLTQKINLRAVFTF
jgi:hypothetical protein